MGATDDDLDFPKLYVFVFNNQINRCNASPPSNAAPSIHSPLGSQSSSPIEGDKKK